MPTESSNNLLRFWIATEDKVLFRRIAERCTPLGSICDMKAADLLNRTLPIKCHVLFLDADGQTDVLEVLKKLSALSFAGRVHLVCEPDYPAAFALTGMGSALGLQMGRALQKPPPRSAIDLLLREAASAPKAARGPHEAVHYRLRFDLNTGLPVAAEAHAHTLALRGDPPDSPEFSEFIVTTILRQWPEMSSASFKPRISLRLPIEIINGRLPDAGMLRSLTPKDPEWPGLVVQVRADALKSSVLPAWEWIARLKRDGYQLAIDRLSDSGLQLLELCRLMPTEINVDSEIVTNSSTDRINAYACQGAIALARTLNARAIARGVKSSADLQMLVRLGCQIGQGDHLSPLMTAEEVAAFIRSGARADVPSLRTYERRGSKLSEREREVLELVSLGLTSKEAGAKLGVSPRTIDAHRSRLMAKLGARNVAELVKRGSQFVETLVVSFMLSDIFAVLSAVFV